MVVFEVVGKEVKVVAVVAEVVLVLAKIGSRVPLMVVFVEVSK